ncbi:MAG: hypothetical protein ACOVKO_05650 [Elstera sp.]
MLSRKFDRADFDARALRADFEALGTRLSTEASDLRRRLHELYYPTFGPLDGVLKRHVLRQFKGWEEYFRSHGAQLFTHAREVEEKLAYSLNLEGRADLKIILETVRDRRTTADLLFRGLAAKMRQAASAVALDAEPIYDFCQVMEQLGLYFRLCAVGLYQPDAVKAALGRDPRYLDIDWDVLRGWADALPDQMRPNRPTETGPLRPPPAALEPPPPVARTAPTTAPAERDESELEEVPALPAPGGERRERRRNR